MLITQIIVVFFSRIVLWYKICFSAVHHWDPFRPTWTWFEKKQPKPLA